MVTYDIGTLGVMLVLAFVSGWAWGSHRAYQNYLREEWRRRQRR